MKTEKIIRLSGLLFFASLTSLTVGCSGKPVLDSESDVYRDYRKLEMSLSEVRSHPNPQFTEKFNTFRTKHGWDYDLSDIPDGIYEAFSVPDKYDYIHYIRFEIKDGKYTGVYYNEFKEAEMETGIDKPGKRYDKDYYEGMKKYGADTDLTKVYPVMEKQLLDSQDPQKVDGVSGASLSLYRFRILIMKSLYEYRTKTIVNTKIYKMSEDF